MRDISHTATVLKLEPTLNREVLPMKRILPALTLYVIAPAIGELLSGSAPPIEFFSPFGLLVLPALYGSGAILVRELALRWDKRWPSILTLGVAYGIVEEGLMVKSFFDPGWPDLGLLGTYDRLAGVNWVWSVALCLYHATISIAIPILLIEMLYPNRRDEHWVRKRGFIALSILLVLVVIFGFLALTPYRPPLLPYLGAIAATWLLYRLAKRLPHQWGVPGELPERARLWLALIGFCGVLFFFLITYGLPSSGAPVLLTLFALVGLGYGLWRSIRWASGDGAWDDRARFSLAAGALSFFILIAPFSENDPSRVDDPSGMTIIAIVAVILLLLLRFRIYKHARSQVTN
jgi:hypothetical protein